MLFILLQGSIDCLLDIVGDPIFQSSHQPSCPRLCIRLYARLAWVGCRHNQRTVARWDHLLLSIGLRLGLLRVPHDGIGLDYWILTAHTRELCLAGFFIPSARIPLGHPRLVRLYRHVHSKGSTIPCCLSRLFLLHFLGVDHFVVLKRNEHGNAKAKQERGEGDTRRRSESVHTRISLV
jgi:hypothetical protein